MSKDQTPQYKPLTIKHVFNAPVEAVWQAWTDPEQLAEWWSPNDFTVPVCELDVKPNGSIRLDMQGPDGTVYPSKGEFKEVRQFEELSFTNAPLDNAGNKLFEVLHTAIFTQNNGKTELVLTSSLLTATTEAVPYLTGMEPGLEQALGKLDNVLNLIKEV